MAEEVAPRKKRDRSPSYPGIGWRVAVERVRTIYGQERRNGAPAEAILRGWGYSPKNGDGYTALAALKKFGLIEDAGSGASRQARISPLGLKLVQLDEAEHQT